MTKRDRRKTVGVILAGGLSTRMREHKKNDFDKCLLNVAGRSMLTRIIERLAPECWPLVLNANGDRERFSRFKLPVIADNIGGFAGPLAGILAAMDWVHDQALACTHLVSVAADTPFFPTNLTQDLLRETQNHPLHIAIANSAGYRQPVFGLWPMSLRSALSEFIVSGKSRKIMAFVKEHDFTDVNFSLYSIEHERVDPFFNVNTPQELIFANRLAEKMI